MLFQAKSQVGLDINRYYEVVLCVDGRMVALSPKLAVDLADRLRNFAEAAGHYWGNPSNRIENQDQKPQASRNPSQTDKSETKE